jgi:hypothetical protein
MRTSKDRWKRMRESGDWGTRLKPVDRNRDFSLVVQIVESMGPKVDEVDSERS